MAGYNANKAASERKSLCNSVLDALQADREPFLPVVKAFEELGISVPVGTALRWCIAGCRGRVLESVKVGHRRATTVSAARRYLERIQDPAHETPRRRRPGARTPPWAEQKLNASGLGPKDRG